MRRASIILALLVSVELFVLGCGSLLNRNPVIVVFNIPDSAAAGGQATLVADATDEDGDSLSFAWTSARGVLSDSAASVTYWSAPVASGLDTITLAVFDGRGGKVTKVGTVVISPVTFTIGWWNGTIRAGDLNYWWALLQPDFRAYGSFSVDSQDINFLMLDDADFRKWQRGETYNAEIEIDNSAGASFADTAKARDYYYFVLDNTHGATEKSAHIHLEGATP